MTDDCALCGGSGWQVIEGVGAKPCPCRREAREWAAKRLAKLNSGPPMNLKAAKELADAMACIPWFPSGENARTAIASQLVRMCATYEQGRYIVKRAVDLCDDWNRCGGAKFLRQILCAVMTPKDGRVLGGTSAAFPEGIPSDVPVGLRSLPPGEFRPAPRQLERGESRPALATGELSADAELERGLIATAATKEPARRRPYLVHEATGPITEMVLVDGVAFAVRKPVAPKPAGEPMSSERRAELEREFEQAEAQYRQQKAVNQG